MQIAHDDLLASVEKSVAYRLTSVRDEVRYRPVEYIYISTVFNDEGLF